MRYPRTIFSSLLCLLFFSCSKKDNNNTTNTVVVPPGYAISYGDSVLFLQSQSTDYIVTPVSTPLTGSWSGFPDGIEIDSKTGAINMSKSEMGLRYRISFLPQGSTDTINTIVLLSGINFLDGFYKLNSKDSVLAPIYNGNAANSLPGVNNGSSFDEGNGCNSAGCNVNLASGAINLAQTVRNGVFGTTPANNDRHEFQLNYRINDKSNKSLNSLHVKLYYFNSMADVTQEAYDIISSRNGTIFRTAADAGTFRVNDITRAAKPRPPCIFIVAK